MANISKVMAGKSGINYAKEAGAPLLQENDNPYEPNYAKMVKTAEEAAGRFGQPNEPTNEASGAISQVNAPNQNGQIGNAPRGTQKQGTQTSGLEEYQQHLRGLQEVANHLSSVSPHDPKDPDPDNEPYGYDATDKTGMLGAAGMGGLAAITDMAARVGQLSTLGAEKLHLTKAGTSDDFTDWYNRKRERNRLLQDAMHYHPIMTELGNIVGSGLATTGLIAGAAAALPGEIAVGTTAGVALTATKAAKIAKWISEAMPSGAAKSIINAQRIGKALKTAEVLGKGALIGETQYDPENNHYISQAIGGAAVAFGADKAVKMMKALATPLGKSIQELSNKYGVSLPVYPSVEKIAKKIWGSNYGKTIQERGTQITKIGEDIAKQITKPSEKFIEDKSYNEYFTGELKKSFDNTSKEIESVNNRINSRVDGKGKVAAPASKKAAAAILKTESEMPGTIQDKFLLGIADDLAPSPGKPWMDYSSFSNTMKRIGAKIGLEKDPDVKAKLGDLYYSMLDDQEKHLTEKAGTDVLNDFYLQKKLYMTKKLPFINGKFQAYRDDNANADNFIGKFFKPDSPTKASEMLELLPDKQKGLIAARAAIINQAMHEAEIPGIGTNPAKFINSVIKLGKTNNVVFAKEQMDSLYGYQRLINMVSDISKDALDPNVIKFGLPQTAATMEKIGKLAALTGGGYYAGAHILGLSSPFLTMIALTPSVFARIVTTKAGRALMNKIHNMAENYTNKELDGVLDGFLKSTFKQAGKITAEQTGAKITRNL